MSDNEDDSGSAQGGIAPGDVQERRAPPVPPVVATASSKKKRKKPTKIASRPKKKRVQSKDLFQSKDPGSSAPASPSGISPSVARRVMSPVAHRRPGAVLGKSNRKALRRLKMPPRSSLPLPRNDSSSGHSSSSSSSCYSSETSDSEIGGTFVQKTVTVTKSTARKTTTRTTTKTTSAAAATSASNPSLSDYEEESMGKGDLEGKIVAVARKLNSLGKRMYSKEDLIQRRMAVCYLFVQVYRSIPESSDLWEGRKGLVVRIRNALMLPKGEGPLNSIKNTLRVIVKCHERGDIYRGEAEPN